MKIAHNKIEHFEREVCKHYGVDYNKELPKGVTFKNCKDAECKFINELIKHNENI